VTPWPGGPAKPADGPCGFDWHCRARVDGWCLPRQPGLTLPLTVGRPLSRSVGRVGPRPKEDRRPRDRRVVCRSEHARHPWPTRAARRRQGRCSARPAEPVSDPQDRMPCRAFGDSNFGAANSLTPRLSGLPYWLGCWSRNHQTAPSCRYHSLHGPAPSLIWNRDVRRVSPRCLAIDEIAPALRFPWHRRGWSLL
jgi:hypothetical protein